jgi:hypothetical protein
MLLLQQILAKLIIGRKKRHLFQKKCIYNNARKHYNIGKGSYAQGGRS